MEQEVITVLGIFKDNKLEDHTTGEIINCATYTSVRKVIEDKLGYYCLKKNEYNDWVIFQYVLI